MIEFDALSRAATFDSPFRFLTATGVLTSAQAAGVRRDYPAIDKSGFLPLSGLEQKGAFAELISDLQSQRLAGILSEKLGLNLEGKPRMITVRRLSKRSDGRIHNDSESKICTMLIYLNEAWRAEDGGGIRALNGPDSMDDYAVEVPPLAGAVFAFKRSETSWHGHPPFTGERYVVQTTFLQSQADLNRKEHSGRAQLFLKKIFGG